MMRTMIGVLTRVTIDMNVSSGTPTVRHSRDSSKEKEGWGGGSEEQITRARGMEGRGGVREGREKKGRKREKSESGIVPLRNTDYAQNLLTTSPYTPEALPTPNHLQCTISQSFST